jgi:hypothetical protein
MLLVICGDPLLMIATFHQQVINNLIEFRQFMPELLRRRLLFFGVNIDLHELVFLLIDILLQIEAEVNRVIQDLLVCFELFIGVFGFELG